MRTPDPNFTPDEAEQARAFLREHASLVQKKLLEEAATDDNGRQLYLIADTLSEEEAEQRRAAGGDGGAGSTVFYVTGNDELIVDFWRSLTTPGDDLRERISKLLDGPEHGGNGRGHP